MPNSDAVEDRTGVLATLWEDANAIQRKLRAEHEFMLEELRLENLRLRSRLAVLESMMPQGMHLQWCKVEATTPTEAVPPEAGDGQHVARTWCSMARDHQAPLRPLAQLGPEAAHGAVPVVKDPEWEASSEQTCITAVGELSSRGGDMDAPETSAPERPSVHRSASFDKVPKKRHGWDCKGAFIAASTDNKTPITTATFREAMTRRIHTRLDFDPASPFQNVNGIRLQKALLELGLSIYSEDDLTNLVKKLNAARRRHGAFSAIGQHLSRSVREVGTIVVHATPKANKAQELSSMKFQRSQTTRASRWTPKAHSFLTISLEPDDIELDGLIECIVNSQVACFLQQDDLRMLNTVAEMLSSGNINTLVSQMTHVDLNELAAPPQKSTFVEWIEPAVAFLIIVNGILLGVQSNAEWEEWIGWFILEIFFVSCFVLELCVRIGHVGLSKFVFGPEYQWNWLDFTIIALALVECAAQQAWNGRVLRLVRLTRLSRLLRVFRFRCFYDLTFMLKGLLGGLHTLGWAMVLLISAIFIVALFLDASIGKEEMVPGLSDADTKALFGTVPVCMFTAFRCFTGDCTDNDGRSLVPILSEFYGYRFTVPYVVSMMIITFGIFNLIVAIYIEATLRAARDEDDVDRSSKRKEALHIARTAKKLMKRLCTLHRIYSSPEFCLNSEENSDQSPIEFVNDFDDIDDPAISMSKEMFQTVMEDRYIQTFMDELDIPPSRTHLFDVVDADGSGDINIMELVQGLLSVRGEPKNVTIACLLSVRSLQCMMRSFRNDMMSNFTEFAEGWRVASCLEGGRLSRSPYRSSASTKVRRTTHRRAPPEAGAALGDDNGLAAPAGDCAPMELAPVGEEKSRMVKLLHCIGDSSKLSL